MRRECAQRASQKLMGKIKHSLSENLRLFAAWRLIDGNIPKLLLNENKEAQSVRVEFGLGKQSAVNKAVTDAILGLMKVSGSV